MTKKINTNPYNGLMPLLPLQRGKITPFRRVHDPEAVWSKLLLLISNGHALTTALREIENPPSYPWCKAQLRENSELKKRYQEAVEDRADYRANEILEIADAPMPNSLEPAQLSAWVQHQRLRVDARKWIAARLAPRQWGDKLAVVTDTRISITKALEDARLRVIDIKDINVIE
jgi:hypothetical protein